MSDLDVFSYVCLSSHLLCSLSQMANGCLALVLGISLPAAFFKVSATNALPAPMLTRVCVRVTFVPIPRAPHRLMVLGKLVPVGCPIPWTPRGRWQAGALELASPVRFWIALARGGAGLPSCHGVPDHVGAYPQQLGFGGK